jgi:hypothetical protein
MAWWFIEARLSDEDRAQLNRIESLLQRLVQQEDRQMAAIDDVRSAVEQDTTVVGSAVTLLNGLTARINELIAAGNNDPALAQLAADLSANNQALAEAVAANTPAS